MKCRARVLYRRGRGCVTGSHRSLGFTVPSGPGEPVLVPSGPPAREIATREPAARSSRSRSPARPCRRPQTPRLWLRRRCSGCRRARPPARRPRREPAARRVGSKPGQALTSPSGTEVVAASLVFRVPSGPPAREIATREPAARSSRSRSPARPCRRPQTPRLWLRRRCSGCRRARPPARRPRREPMARRVGSKPGQALRSRRHPPHWWRGCVVGGQTRTWRIHGLGAELPCTRRRVRKM